MEKDTTKTKRYKLNETQRKAMHKFLKTVPGEYQETVLRQMLVQVPMDEATEKA